MARIIKRPSAFKTCYIADVKERIGIKVRKAHNRRADERKHKVPDHLRKYIEEAIKILFKEQATRVTYKMIQEKAFELYRKDIENQAEANRFMGVFKDDPDVVKEIAEDEGFIYEA